MYCDRCSRKIDDDAEKCPYCGQPVKDSDRRDEIFNEEKKIEKTQTGMLVGLVLNMFGLIGLAFLNKAKKSTSKFADPNKTVDKNSYIRGVFFGSILQIVVILLVLYKTGKL